MPRLRWWIVGAAALVAAYVLAVRRLPPCAEPFSDFGAVPLVSISGDVEVPPTAIGRAIVSHLEDIQRTERSGRYRHRTDVDTAHGHYDWDCSGMVGWMLQRHAPRAFAALGRSRPVAADYARVIAAASSDPDARPIRRIARIRDVRAGDVFAWRSPEYLRDTNSTGHVGFVLGTPRHAAGIDLYAARIADSTTLPHELDTRLAALDRDGGLGTGIMTFAVDADGAVTHYGWMGTLSPVYIEARVVFARLE